MKEEKLTLSQALEIIMQDEREEIIDYQELIKDLQI
jgi:hypothetical protein